MIGVREVARIQLPTISGEFDTRAFECASGHVYLAMIKGEIGDGHAVLTRVHSECLTGDALGSLRCDCGAQLDLACAPWRPKAGVSWCTRPVTRGAASD
jgi:GTP cyclohydrolase II